MKYLLSISWHTFDVLSASLVVDLFSKSDMLYVDGIEVSSCNYDDNLQILNFCLENNLIFQCHAPKFDSNFNIFDYLSDIHKLSKIYGSKINIVLHSLESDDFLESVYLTKDYVKSLHEYISLNNLNVSISLENLNFHHNRSRINVDTIDDILCCFENLNFTYDVGHDIFDFFKNSKLSDLQKLRLNNVHLHNVYNDRDHELIFKNVEYLEFLKNAINDLKKLNFNKNIVVEVGVDMHDGNNFSEKMINYIDSIVEIKNFFD